MATSSADRIDILDCPINRLTTTQVVDLVDRVIGAGEQMLLTDVDAGKLALMSDDRLLRDHVLSSDYIVADGMSLVWMSKLMGRPLPERITGIDLLAELLALADRRGHRVFLLGGSATVIEQMAALTRTRYPGAALVGYRQGFFDVGADGPAIAETISELQPNMLFVAMNTPKKEQFLEENREALGHVNFKMGVGGAFDVHVGQVARAPVWMQKACLEWLFRFLQEPRRQWKNEVLDNVSFVRLVASQSLMALPARIARQ